MLIFLFGHPGAGKNYVGKVLSQYFNYYFWDADLALTSAMKACIVNKQVFTQAMRDQFTQLIIENTIQLCHQHQNVAVAQALFKEKNRQQLAAAFPEARFILIEASSQTILTRLRLRNNAVDATYAEKIRAEFEAPQIAYQLLINNSDEKDILYQLGEWGLEGTP